MAACSGEPRCTMELSVKTPEICTAINSPADDATCTGVTLDGNAATCTGAGGGNVCEHRAETHIDGSPYGVEVLSAGEKIQVAASMPGSASDFDEGTGQGLYARTHFRQGIADALIGLGNTDVDLSKVDITGISGNRRLQVEDLEGREALPEELTGRRLQTNSVTVTYTVESVADLTATFEADTIGATLVAAINAATVSGMSGSWTPLDVADFVSAAPQKLSPYPSVPANCYATGQGRTSAMAGREQSFGIQLVNEYDVAQQITGNEVPLATISCAELLGCGDHAQGDVVATSTYDFNSTVDENTDGSFTLYYTVDTKGSWSMAVTIDGAPVRDSPFALEVSSNVGYANDTFLTTDPAWVSHVPAVAGTSKLISVLPVDGTGNREDYGRDMNISRLAVSYMDSTDALVSLSVSSVPVDGESLYTSEILENIAGTYTLAVTLYGLDILDSPFDLVVVAGAAAIENFRVAPEESITAAGLVGTLQIFARDAYLNAVPPGDALLQYSIADATPAAYPTLPPVCEDYPDPACCYRAMMK